MTTTTQTSTQTTKRKGLAELVDSTPLLHDADALRVRGADDGHLFFKGLLPVDDVLEVRADILGVVEKHGWRQPRQDPFGGAINTGVLNTVADELMRLDIGVSIEA